MEFCKITEAQNRAPQDVQNEFVESQEELLRKEKALRDTQLRSKHEMLKLKRAQIQQVDEMSIQRITKLFISSLSNCSICKNR